MTTLIVGASGATGKLLVEQLLKAGQKVKVIVRPTSNFPDAWNNHDRITVIPSNVTEMSVGEIARHLAGCQAIASCLGHNLTLKGIFGKPRKLVTDTVRLLCKAALESTPERPIKFVLMNTAGNSSVNESVSVKEKMAVALIRLLLPPHTDNEKAADYLWNSIGQQNPLMEWVVVRPDTLTNEREVTEYAVQASPTRSAIFNPGKTSRINVGHFMAMLITDEDLWEQWKGQMPVIYNIPKTASPIKIHRQEVGLF
ncbi:NAD(P)-dependent oxidoreductase [Negadavirga shengliensis]|uniref:NAD(P)-dependent oxidoreductase n=1 Tax=Negadavirga shengliensis TaxID=1389218 RepID=A0ABV9SWG2_9BACT